MRVLLCVKSPSEEEDGNLLFCAEAREIMTRPKPHIFRPPTFAFPVGQQQAWTFYASILR